MAEHNDPPAAAEALLGVDKLKTIYDQLLVDHRSTAQSQTLANLEEDRRRPRPGGLPKTTTYEQISAAKVQYGHLTDAELFAERQGLGERLMWQRQRIRSEIAPPLAVALDREGKHDEAYELGLVHSPAMMQLMGARPSDHVLRRFLDDPITLDEIGLHDYVRNIPKTVAPDLLERVYFHAPPRHRVDVAMHPSLTLSDSQKMKANLADFWYRYEEEVRPEHFATVKAAFAPKDGVARLHVVTDHRGRTGEANVAISRALTQHAEQCQQALLAGHSVEKKKTIDLTGKSSALINRSLQLAAWLEHEHVFVRDVKGEKHVLVYRGFGGTYAQKLGIAAGIWAAGTPPHLQEPQAPPRKTVVLNTAPMSSWTTNRRVAEGFAVERGSIPGQPDGYGMVVKKWLPLKDLLHSGHHQVFHGQTHAHPDEHELVFGHPDGHLKVKTSEIFSHQFRSGEDEDDTDMVSPDPQYVMDSPLKALKKSDDEQLAKALPLGLFHSLDLPGVPGYDISPSYVSSLDDDHKVAAAGNLAKEGNWVGALQVAGLASHSRDAFSRLAQYGIPHQAIGRILDHLNPLDYDNPKVQAAVLSHRQQFLFEMANHIPDDIPSDLLHRMWKLSGNDRYSQMQFEEHPNMKMDADVLGLHQAGEFWKGYELAVKPEHFAAMQHMARPDSAEMMRDASTGKDVSRVTLVDHRGNSGSSENVAHMFPDLDRYARLTQEAVSREAREDPDTIKVKKIGGKPHVLVYRGFGGTYAQKLQEALGTSHFDPNRAEIDRLWPELEGEDLRYLGGKLPDAVLNDPDRERAKKYYPLWQSITGRSHSVSLENRSVVLPMASISSWTIDPGVAQGFARNRHIEGQPERRGVVLKKWMPLENLVHSGFHDMFPGQSHAHKHEFELVFKHPDQKLKISSKDVHGVQNPHEYEDADEDFTRPRVLPKVVKLTKSEDDPVYYHGTLHSFSSFQPRPGYNTTTLTEPSQVQRHGFFFSDHPEHAREYAGDGGRVISAHLANHESIDLSSVPWSLEESVSMGHVPRTQNAHEHDPEGVLQRHGVNTNDLRHMKPWQAFDGDFGKRFVAALKDLGYDSANFKEEHEVVGASPSTHVVFDPGQIHQIVKSEPELQKMALKDIKVPTPSEDRAYDYSHLLPEDVRKAGGQIVVRAGHEQGHHLIAKYLHGGYRGGEVHGYVTVEGLDIDRSALNTEHRGKGVGAALYEALMSHAHNALGVQYVMGDVHSSMAGKVHERLGAKHGLEYRPAYNRPVDQPKPHDAARGSYRYALKSEDGLRKDETEDESRRQAEEKVSEGFFQKWRKQQDPSLLSMTTPEVIERHLGELSARELYYLLPAILPKSPVHGGGPLPGLRQKIAERLLDASKVQADLGDKDDAIRQSARILAVYLPPERLGEMYDHYAKAIDSDPDYDHWSDHTVAVKELVNRRDRPPDLLPKMMTSGEPTGSTRRYRIAVEVMSAGQSSADDLRAAWPIAKGRKRLTIYTIEAFLRNHKTPDDLFESVATGIHPDGTPYVADDAVAGTLAGQIEQRHLPEEVLRRIHTHLDNIRSRWNGQSIGPERTAAQAVSRPLMATRNAIEIEDPDLIHTESVGVRMDSARLRQGRDIVDMLQPQAREEHPKRLPAGDWSVGRLPNGNIGAEKLQQAIDAIPPQRWNVSHTHWNSVQRHSDEASRVFQLNITTDQVKKMREAGVYDTFRDMHKATMSSLHPVTPTTIGWVRYTSDFGEFKRMQGTFVDEVQSDFGRSFVKQAQGQMRQRAEEEGEQMRAQGVPEERVQDHVRGRMDEVTRNAESKWPHEHFRKISEILFQGRHPNHILAEAFLQHLRDRGPGMDDTHVGWHSTETKGPISNMSMDKPLPGHFKTTYEDIPKRLGLVPAKYGEMETQTPGPRGDSDDPADNIHGKRTWIGKVRKSEDPHDATA